MPSLREPHAPPRARLFAALLVVYVVWGSTYLAIRFAIETLPPFTMAGLRFLVAGGLLYAWGRWRDRERPASGHWPRALAVGALLLLGGHGGVVWGQHRVPSGMTALVIATEPLWVALLAALPPWRQRVGARTVAGLAAGFAGVALLVGRPGETAAARAVDPLGAAVIVLAAASWAAGSLLGSGGKLPRSPWVAGGMQLVCGSVLLLLLGGARGEWSAIDPATFSTRSILAFLYLLVFGSLVGFSAYAWLVHHAPPTLVSTYAFVNPLVAMALGWLLAGERVVPRAAGAAVLILAAVVTIVFAPERPRVGAPEAEG